MRGLSRSSAELRHVQEPLAPSAQLLLVVRSEAFRPLDEELELRQTGCDGIGIARQLVVSPARCGEVLPRERRVAAPTELFGAAEGVEHVELERRPREPTLLELPGHGDQPLGGRSDVFACDRAAPGVRPGPAVAEDAPGKHEARLPFRAELGECRDVFLVEESFRDVELGLDVGLRALGSDGGRVRACAQEQPDRLREDRLPSARLARDGVEAWPELELGLVDQHEVLDAQPTEHASRTR